MNDKYTFVRKLMLMTGIYPGMFLRTIKGVPRFFRDYSRYQRLNGGSSFQISVRHLFPILSDWGESAGMANGHYFHQDLWAARKVFKNLPKHHIDVGSRVDGFIAHLLVFMGVTIIDIRQLESNIRGLRVVRDNATELRHIPNDSVESLSSLHAAEHFGLGRYSDPIDPQACFKFMETLQRVLAIGGHLYFSVPVGNERVEFNAHRVFAPQTVIGSFRRLRLESFAFVDDNGDLCENAEPSAAQNCKYGCGLFEFVKAT